MERREENGTMGAVGEETIPEGEVVTVGEGAREQRAGQEGGAYEEDGDGIGREVVNDDEHYIRRGRRTARTKTTTKKKKKKYGFIKRFTYQQLKGWRPILAVNRAQYFFVALGTVLIALGIPILVAALDVVEYTVRYDNVGVLAGMDNQERLKLVTDGNGVNYTVPLTVDKHMKAPIYFIYELNDFYQNYRRYVRSYDANQMHNGGNLPGGSACDPYIYQGFSVNDSLPENGAILPCGQISHSNFNDSFLISMDSTPLDINSSNIAWKSDAEHLYGNVTSINYNTNPIYRGGNTSTLPLNENQQWMVWQRPAAHRLTNKLYGVLYTDIPEGTVVNVQVFNRYNTYSFGGEKYFKLTTNSWVGGRNLTLPILYMIAAGLSYVLAAFFFMAYHGGFMKKRIPGDESRLSWIRSSGLHRHGHQHGWRRQQRWCGLFG